MAKPSTKRRSGDDQTDENIFGALGLTDPDAGAADDNGGQRTGVSVEALQAQIADLNRKLEERDTAFIRQDPVRVDVREQAKPLFDTKGLPDPVTQTEEYNSALAERIQQAIIRDREQNTLEVSARYEQENRADALYNDFVEKYEDYADEEKVLFATQKVVNKARQRGIDVDRYMYGASDKFFRDVVKEYDGVFGKPGAQSQVDGDDDASDDDGEPDNSRAINLFGGQAGGQSGGKPKDKPTDMIKDIQDLQRASGFF